MAGSLTIASAPQKAKQLAAIGAGFAANPKGRRAVMAGATLLMIAAAAWAISALQPRSNRAVAPGMAEADKAAAMELLLASGFKPDLDGDTGEIEVRDSDYHRARMALAAGGLPKAVPGGYAALDNLPLGISRSVESARLRQSEETDLAATIMAIGGVENAQVHLAEAQDSPFVRGGAKASAAVFVKLAAGRTLDGGQTDAIVHLVSASVPGLAAERVSVVDQTGRLLTARDAATPQLGRDELDYAAEIERRIKERIAALLVPIAGPGNYSAEVTVDIDFARMQSTREQVDPANAVIASEQGQAASASPPPAAGIPGVLSNVVPQAPQTVATLPQSRSLPEAARDRSYTRTFAVGRTIDVIDPAAGALRKLSVGIVLRAGAGLGTKDIPRIAALVRDAIGADARRGDRVSVIVAPFATLLPLPPEPWLSNDMLQAGERIAGPLVAALILTFGIGRPLAARLIARQALGSSEPPVRLTSAAEQQQQIEAVRIFVRENPRGASRALRQLVQHAP